MATPKASIGERTFSVVAAPFYGTPSSGRSAWLWFYYLVRNGVFLRQTFNLLPLVLVMGFCLEFCCWRVLYSIDSRLSILLLEFG